MGKLTWRTGEVYEGDWKDDMMHGIGKILDKNGETKKIKFKMNVIEKIE